METNIFAKLLKGKTPEEAIREAKLNADPRIKVTLTKRTTKKKKE